MFKQYITLKYSYIVVFVLLAFWALFAYLTMHSLINSQEKYAKLINLSGKQRMLSQKTALMVARYNLERNKKLLTHLQELANIQIKEHNFITSSIESDELKAAYFGSALNLDKYVESYNSLLFAYIISQDSKLVPIILEESFNLVPKLNEAVSIFENESNAKIEYLKSQELFIFIATILTLILEAIFLIRPIMNKLSNKFEILEDMLQKKTKEVYLHSKVFKHSLDGIMITDENNIIIDVNDSFSKITGYQKGEMIGQNPSILKSGQHPEEFYLQMWNDLKHNSLWNGKIINKRKNSEQYYEDLTILCINNNGKVVNYIGIINDITAEYETQKQLNDLAHYDHLTKLANRNLMYDRLKHAVGVGKRHNTLVVVIFIDLDNFKTINDTMGHDKGDDLLKEIASRLRKISRDSDTLCRLGGDEFLIILEGIVDVSGAITYLEKLKKEISKTFIIESNDFNPTASIGVSIFPKDSTDINELIKFADLAMYKSKENGKNNYNFYTDELNEKITNKLKIEKDLEYGLTNHEFVLHYQPKVNPYQEKIMGCEALIRWQKNGKLVFPGEFIAIAEESILISQIGDAVLDMACKQISLWKGTEFQNLTISVNVSSKQFMDTNFVTKIRGLLEKYEIDGNKLIFEITEYSLVQNVIKTTELLNELKKIGIYSAIDDFGVGYSSLNYLKRLPLKYLKVDKSFIDDILEDNDSAIITKTILAMSRSLNFKTIAEGVETKEQVEFLRNENCDLIQGYYYSKPLNITDFESLFYKMEQKNSNL